MSYSDIPEIKDRIPEISPESREQFRKPFELYIDSAYSTIVTNDIGKQVIAELNNDPRVQNLRGQTLTIGVGPGLNGSGLNIDSLAKWFIWYASKHGNEQTLLHLNKYLDAEEIQVSITLWVLGLDVHDEIILNDGYKIRSLNKMPASSEKAEYNQVLRGKDSAIPRSAISCSININKTYDVNDRTRYSAIRDTADSVKTCLEQIAWLLNSYEGISCLPYCATSYLEDHTPPGPFKGGYVSKPTYYHDIIGSGLSLLNSDTHASIDSLIVAFNELAENERKRLQTILRRLCQSKRAKGIESKILDLGIALEMMLLDDNNHNDQLSLSFRLRGSWLLANDKEERTALYMHLKNIYIYRSQVAHTGMLKTSDITKVKDLLPEYQSLAGRICRHLLINGRPDWDKVILDSD